MTEEENHPQNPKRLEGLTLEDTIHNVGADSSTGTKDSGIAHLLSELLAMLLELAARSLPIRGS
jgi:hypothetical protein